MKHAGPDALRRLALIVEGLRGLPGLREPRPGVFYRRSRAFLHFHEHGEALYADVRTADDRDFDRFKVDEADPAGFVAFIAARLGAP